MGVKIIRLNKGVTADNDTEAEQLRARLKERGVFLVNVMSSPGAGKTTTLLSLIERLSPFYRIGVMEADIEGDFDAVKIAERSKAKSVQLHTGGMCHLDAAMTKQGLDELGTEDLDLVFLENVGNLVCPAEFDTGACLDMMILSVPEGDDKPLKYPLIFQKCGLVLINKTDTLPYFNFDVAACTARIKARNKNATVIAVSAKTGDNMGEVTEFFKQTITNRKEN